VDRGLRIQLEEDGDSSTRQSGGEDEWSVACDTPGIKSGAS